MLCWDDVESVMGSSHHNHKIQIVRVQFVDGMKFVGILIPSDCVKPLKEKLAKAELAEQELKRRQQNYDDENSYEDNHYDANDLQFLE